MKEMLNITARDPSGIAGTDHAKSAHAKAAGEASGFSEEVKKFSEAEDNGKPGALQNTHRHKALGRNEHSHNNKTQRNSENERLVKEESAADVNTNTYINNASAAENGDSLLNDGEMAVTLNVQEFTPDVVDKAESFIAAYGKTEAGTETAESVSPAESVKPIEAVKQSPIPLFAVEDVELIKVVKAQESVKSVKDAPLTVNEDAVKQIGHEAFLDQAREILEQARSKTFDKLKLFRDNPLSDPKPLSELPWTVESVAKILAVMAQNGEFLHYLGEENGDLAAALLKKYDEWVKSHAGEVQSAFVNSTDSSVVNTTVNTADNAADNAADNTNANALADAADGKTANANTNEKLTGYIPQATDPAQLNMAGSKIDWAADDKLAVTVDQKTAAYSSDQSKIISQQTTAANLTPVDSQTMRAMYKQESENVNINASEKESIPAPVMNSQQNAKQSIIEGAQIPVSYTDLANTPSALQQNLTAETSVQPVQRGESSAQLFSQPADVNAASGSADGALSLTLSGAVSDVETSDSQDTLHINTQANAAKAVEMTEKALSSLSRVDQQAIIEQITEKLQLAVRSGVHEMRITLRPQELGEVRMNIRVEGDQVTARMLVESEQVKAIVEKHFQQLKDALEQQNLQAAKLSVDVGTDADRKQLWQEMTAMANQKRSNKNGNGESDDSASDQDNNVVTAFGADTGRRYGTNTFELFV
ncbi:MAG: flagellar hook-length control protein FliK [Chitinispirillia bacterium]|nr:flagellar hook-length control protein FliK [Chitinispirillia bacterium]